MSTIINTYPVFESSQVLTSAQLNQLVAYLDQQNRLTRVKLVGMGIVCGLELSYDEDNARVTISKGTAITSEGFLITLGECETSYYRPYSLPEGVEYKPFGDPVQDITLYELLREMPEDSTGVELLNEPAGFLDDKFVLLFLECFDNDLRSCLGQSCDDLGMDRIFTVRKLLVSQADLDVVLTRSGNVGGLYPDKFNLPHLVMPRALFDPAQPHSQDYNAFSEHYRSTFQDSIYPALFGDLSNPGALSETYSIYEPLLGPLYGFANPFETTTVTALKNDWRAFFEGTSSPGPQYLGMQYFYDFLKDLILAYDEFREWAFDLMAECCPDMSLFPKHVMLGRANTPLETEEEAQTYRHRFAQPPVYNQQKHRLEKTIALHKRLVLMVEKFNLDLVNNPGGQESVSLKITPSREKKTALSDRSIPYYYRSKEESPIVGAGTLEYYWSPGNSRMTGPPAQPLVVSYENQLSDQSNIGSNFETPLYYDLDDFPFLRIEGHIGMDFQNVASTIQSRVDQFNLPFDTVALQLNPDAGTVQVDYSCGFEDLQEDYFIHRNTFYTTVRHLVQLYNDNLDRIPAGGILDPDTILSIPEQLESVLPPCVEDFDFEAFREAYRIVLQFVIEFVLIMEIPVNGVVPALAPLAYKLLDLSFYTRFYQVFYAFRRREFYLQRETQVFSRYLQKHPGVEHQGGVYKGGTFILVYDTSDEGQIIADFNLPYLCCSTDRCIPSCDEGFALDLPPFARPDYAITMEGLPVDINVIINDFGLQGGNYSIDIVDNTTANGGQIELDEQTGLIRYTPAEGFTGVDTFQYQLEDQDTSETDLGLVTVLVKEPGTSDGCYSRAVLECWGLERVDDTLRGREIDISNLTVDQRYDALLQSLASSRGFTIDEIRFNVLEDPGSRRDLLNCLGIPIDASTTYEQLEQLIVSYQNTNCGGDRSSCYSRAVLECWGLERVEDTLREREIDISNLTVDQRYDALLQSLAFSRGFTIDEIRFNVLEDPGSRSDLLNCLGIPIDASTTYEQLEELILNYQNANCGGGGSSCYSRAVLECWGLERVEDTLGNREIDISDLTEDQLYDALLQSLASTRGFTIDEIRSNVLEDPGSRRDLLNCLEIPIDASTTYEQLEELIINYQNENCGRVGSSSNTITVTREVLTENDVQGVLAMRNISFLPGASAQDKLGLLQGSPRGMNFTADEIISMGKPTITKIMSESGIAFNTRDTKQQLLDKLFSTR